MMGEVAGSSPAVRDPKLYVVTRADLATGLRTAQVAHAVVEWTLLHGRPPDNLVVLVVPNEASLRRYAVLDARTVVFEEPDLDGEATAVAIGPEGWRRLSSLPLLR